MYFFSYQSFGNSPQYTTSSLTHSVKSLSRYLPHSTNKFYCLNVYLMFDNFQIFSSITFLVGEAQTGFFFLFCWLISNSHTFVCFSFQLKKKHASYSLFHFSQFLCHGFWQHFLQQDSLQIFYLIIDLLLEKCYHIWEKFVKKKKKKKKNFFLLCHVSPLTQGSVGSRRDLWLPYGLHRLNSWRSEPLAWVTSGIYTFA